MSDGVSCGEGEGEWLCCCLFVMLCCVVYCVVIDIWLVCVFVFARCVAVLLC